MLLSRYCVAPSHQVEVLFAVPASADLNGQVVRFLVYVAGSAGRKSAKSGRCNSVSGFMQGKAGCFLNQLVLLCRIRSNFLRENVFFFVQFIKLILRCRSYFKIF